MFDGFTAALDAEITDQKVMDAPQTRQIIRPARSRAASAPATTKGGSPVVDLLPDRVLLADDSFPMLELVGTLLQNCGVANVYPVNCGTAAIEFLYNSVQPIDCVIADLDMPMGTGLNLLQTIRAGVIRGVRPDMCVILFSGLWTTESLNLSRQLDVNGVLAKPFSPTKLRDELVAARRRIFPLDMLRYRGVLLPS